jgi:hypothetical protein
MGSLSVFDYREYRCSRSLVEALLNLILKVPERDSAATTSTSFTRR